MSLIVNRSVFMLRWYAGNIANYGGASPLPNGGWRLFLADGTSRLATQTEIDTATTWADARLAEHDADDADAVTVRGDAQVRNLMLMTPAQIDQWAAANIGNITQARAAIITLAKAVSMLARRALR